MKSVKELICVFESKEQSSLRFGAKEEVLKGLCQSELRLALFFIIKISRIIWIYGRC